MSMTRQPFWLAIALVLLAYALRLRDIDRYDLWHDEVGQVIVAQAPTLAELLQGVSKHHAASPMSYLCTAVTARLAGQSELALRFEPLMWSVLAVALTLRAARALAPAGAWWAGLLAAISPFAIRYAQEVRFYSLGLMWACAMFCMVALAAKGDIRLNRYTWFALVGVTAGALYSHVYSALIALPAFMIALLVAQPSNRLRLALWQAGAYIAAGIAFLPWMLSGLAVKGHRLVLNTSPLQVVLAGLEVTPRVLPSAERAGEGAFAIVMLALSALALVYAFAQIRRAPWMLGGAFGVALAIAVVCALNLAAGYFFAHRQFLFLQPVRFVLIGATLAPLAGISPAILHLSFAAGLTALSLVYTNADLHRAERSHWRPLARAVAAQHPPFGAPAIIVPYWTRSTLEYYLRLAGVEFTWLKLSGDQPTAQDLQQAPDGTLCFVPQAATSLLPLLDEASFREITLSPSSPPHAFRMLVKSSNKP